MSTYCVGMIMIPMYYCTESCSTELMIDRSCNEQESFNFVHHFLEVAICRTLKAFSEHANAPRPPNPPKRLRRAIAIRTAIVQQCKYFHFVTPPPTSVSFIQNSHTHAKSIHTKTKNPTHTFQPTPVRSAILSILFIVPRNRTPVPSN